MFMKPEVLVTDTYEVETRNGITFLPKDVVGSVADSDTLEPFIGDDEVLELTFHKAAVLSRLSAPGFLDCTEYTKHDSVAEAWEYLVDTYPGSFTWSIETTADPEAGETPTAHMYAPCDEAAAAVQNVVGSIEGSRIERDGSFVYAPIQDPDAAFEALMAEGFNTKEVA